MSLHIPEWNSGGNTLLAVTSWLCGVVVAVAVVVVVVVVVV